MPGTDGLSVLEQVRRDHPETKVVILSASSDEAVIAAGDAGDVTVTRAGNADFRCPVVQP